MNSTKEETPIEKLFDAYKTIQDADKLYLHDDESVYGLYLWRFFHYMLTANC